MFHFFKIALFLLLLYMQPSHAQDTIYWDKLELLAWKDFHASPQKDAVGSALAATGVALKFRYQKDEATDTWTYDYQVRSYFLPKNSWYKPQDSNYYLLAHEQTHFAISELYARKMKKKLSQLTASEDIEDKAKEIYQNMQKLHALAQSKYDRETNHSLNVEVELEWQAKIIDSLKQYHD